MNFGEGDTIQSITSARLNLKTKGQAEYPAPNSTVDLKSSATGLEAASHQWSPNLVLAGVQRLSVSALTNSVTRSQPLL